MRPEIIRDENGRLIKHWTMESAEAADRWRREQQQAKLVDAKRKRRWGVVERLRIAIARLGLHL